MPFRDMLLAIAVAAAFGIAFVFIRLGVNEVPPLMLTAARYVFAAFPAVLFVARPKVGWGWIAAYGLVQGAIMFGQLFTAVSLGMPAGLASVIVQLQVFFTMALYALAFGERPQRLQLIGAGVAFLGIAVIGGGGQGAVPLVPFFIVIGAAFAWGCANTIARAAKPDNMLGYVVWSSLFAPLVLIPASLWLEGERALNILSPSLTVIVSVAFLAYAATVFSFATWIRLLGKYGAARVAPFALLIPVFGIASTALVLHEKIPPAAWLGGILVLMGLAINLFGTRLIGLVRRVLS